MKTTTTSLLLAAVSAFAVASNARADDAATWRVWTVAETLRVSRETPAPAEGAPAAAISAARNEWEGFQILMRSAEPIAGVSIEPADLVGPGGAVLPAGSARLYRQHQFEITQASYRNDGFAPGWRPDALIPFRHPVTNEPLPDDARFKAAPFDLPADQTHGFFVDLFAPADAASGVYRGTYRVTAANRPAIDVPVELTVWNFALPATPTFKTEFGSPAGALRGYYRKRAEAGIEPAPANWSEVEDQCARMLAEHRFNATPPQGFAPTAQADGSFAVADADIAALRDFIDAHHVNAVQIPHPRGVVKDPDAERPRLLAWLAAWNRALKVLDRPDVVFFTYLLDEPNDREAYEYVQKWGRAIRSAHSRVQVLVVEQTKTQDPAWGDLYGAVDIWCPLFPLFDSETAAARQALGETLWTYTALCQGKEPTPWWQTDFPLLNYRVPAWTAWRYRIRGLLYWGGMAFWDHVDDPWSDPKTYQPDRNKEGARKLVFNGDGSLVYPARAVGYDGIVPSLRLKALRDSIEDYEYLAILERAGRADAAMKIVQPVAESWTRWDHDPGAFQRARARLAELIVAP